MEEIWKPIIGYEGLYEVSNLGRIKSLKRTVKHPRGGDKVIKERILKGNCNSGGYIIIKLNKNGNKKSFAVHSLVAIAFIPNPENKPCVDHINTIKTDNRVENLRWVTQKENVNNPLSIEHKSEAFKGENNPNYEKRGKDNSCSKKIVQLDLQGDLIKIWDSMHEARREGHFNVSNISNCCKGNRKTHKGFKWMYYDEWFETID